MHWRSDPPRAAWAAPPVRSTQQGSARRPRPPAATAHRPARAAPIARARLVLRSANEERLQELIARLGLRQRSGVGPRVELVLVLRQPVEDRRRALGLGERQGALDRLARR